MEPLLSTTVYTSARSARTEVAVDHPRSVLLSAFSLLGSVRTACDRAVVLIDASERARSASGSFGGNWKKKAAASGSSLAPGPGPTKLGNRGRTRTEQLMSEGAGVGSSLSLDVERYVSPVAVYVHAYAVVYVPRVRKKDQEAPVVSESRWLGLRPPSCSCVPVSRKWKTMSPFRGQRPGSTCENSPSGYLEE